MKKIYLLPLFIFIGLVFAFNQVSAISCLPGTCPTGWACDEDKAVLYKGTCTWFVCDETISIDCNANDGWYPSGECTEEYRNYYCTLADRCDNYSVTKNRNVANGTACAGGTCQDGICVVAGCPLDCTWASNCAVVGCSKPYCWGSYGEYYCESDCALNDNYAASDDQCCSKNRDADGKCIAPAGCPPSCTAWTDCNVAGCGKISCWGSSAGSYTCQTLCAKEGKYAPDGDECCGGLAWNASTKQCYKAIVCTDSDGGKDPDVKGTCNGTNGNFTDSCSATPDTVVEYYCNSSNECVDIPLICAGSCIDGACAASKVCSALPGGGACCASPKFCKAGTVIPDSTDCTANCCTAANCVTPTKTCSELGGTSLCCASPKVCKTGTVISGSTDCTANNCCAAVDCVTPSTKTCSDFSATCKQCLSIEPDSDGDYNTKPCGWTGSSCESGSSDCPSGYSAWYWDNCSENACTGGPSGGVSISLSNPLKFSSFKDLVNGLINFIFTLGVILAPLMYIVAGFYFVTAGGDSQRVTTGKQIALYTTIGLGIILFARGLIAVLKTIIGG